MCSHVQLFAVTCSHVQSRVVTYSTAEDVEYEGYPNLSKNMIKSNAAQFFLACLLVLLAGCPHYCLEGLEDLTVGLIIGLAIGGVVLIAGEVAIGLSGWSL